jgi:Na+(H+)/acetate symporter ActP
MSATARPTPRSRLPHREPVRRDTDDAQLAVRRIGALAALALAVALLAGAFAGIVLFVAGLALLAAYAATHPHHR